MTLYEFRYNIEHRLFTKYYFEDTPAFFAALLGNEDEEEKNYLFEIVSDISNKCGFTLPYNAEQYDVELYELEDENFMCKITFPIPEESTLCSHIYLMLSEDYSNARYFTVEFVEAKMKRKRYCLGEWTAEGRHINYGFLTNRIDKNERKIIELFQKGLE